jgi:inorganic pyrophosphatase
VISKNRVAKVKSIAEKLPSIANLEGEALTMVRFWVKKMSVEILCTPFLVEETKT